MKKILRALPPIVLALTVTTAQGTAVQPDVSTERMLVANERALQDAVGKGDKTSFLSLVAPEGVWTSKQGFIPMEMLADGLQHFQLTRWEVVNPRVISLGADCAIVQYAWRGAGTFHNQPLAPTTLASSVWTRRDGKWRAVHHQQTELVSQ